MAFSLSVVLILQADVFNLKFYETSDERKKKMENAERFCGLAISWRRWDVEEKVRPGNFESSHVNYVKLPKLDRHKGDVERNKHILIHGSGPRPICFSILPWVDHTILHCPNKSSHVQKVHAGPPSRHDWALNPTPDVAAMSPPPEQEYLSSHIRFL